jgi:hypothetical protein
VNKDGFARLQAPRWKTLCQTVMNVSGMDAAATIPIPGGIGNVWVSCAVQYCA